MENRRMNDNMKIWDQLQHTDPNATKTAPSKWGKKITTIDPMSQIQSMTSMFGPVGKGWKYEVEYKYIDGLVFAEVKIKWFDKQWNEYGPVCSVQNLTNTRGGLDDEAPKKAMTDAMTKAFSHLGLNADVFLGKFDNIKYVEEMKHKFSKEIPQSSGPKHGSESTHVKSVQRIISEIERCQNIYNFRKVVKKNQPFIDTALKNRNVANFTLIDDVIKNKERELNRRT